MTAMRTGRLVAALTALLAAAACAAADVNRASQAELESVKGIGPALSTVIVGERRHGEFASWADLMRRVRGMSAASAERFSRAGLTVNGKAYREP
jgi:competence protein ComEA